MRYLLLIHEDPAATSAEPAAFEAMLAEYAVYTQSLADAGRLLGGEALQPPTVATTVSVRDGRRIVTDGPFAETKEQLAGYYLVEAPDLDAVIEDASRIPGARHGAIEIRPILEMG